MALSASPDPNVSIDAVLARIADHMTHLADKLASTEAAVSEHYEELLENNVDAFQDVQNLDYLYQSMTDTAALLSTLGKGCRQQMTLIGELKLETTRALVCDQRPVDNYAVGGEFDLF